MVTIAWDRAGNVGQDEATKEVVDGFDGAYYCDQEILSDDEYSEGQGCYAKERLQAYLKNHIQICVDKKWSASEVIQQPPVLKNGIAEGPAIVTAYVTNDGDRLEHWTAAPREDDTYSNLDDDCSVLLSTSAGHMLIVGCACGHPYVATNDFSFQNSDGSTHPAALRFDSAQHLIDDMCARAVEYCYEQVH